MHKASCQGEVKKKKRSWNTEKYNK